MYRGTTPTYILTFDKDIDFSEASDIFVTFSTPGYRMILEKTGNALEIDDNVIYVFLDQEDTLAMPRGEILLQVNWTYLEGSATKRVCSEIVSVPSCRNLKDEVIR